MKVIDAKEEIYEFITIMCHLFKDFLPKFQIPIWNLIAH